MNNKFYSLALILFLAFQTQLYSQDLTAAEIFEKVNDAVVVIYGYDEDSKVKSQGSGVVVSDDGLVLTNFHVVAGCQKFGVFHNNKLVEYASIKALDYENDLLILQIPPSNFKKIDLGNSENIRVGEKIYAIGSPLGLENTISEGIISGIRNTEEKNKDKIQITASISPGSSGGAVVNTKCELIGISSSQIKTGQNLNFAIPINTALFLLNQTISNPDITEAYVYFYRGINEFIESNHKKAVYNFTEVIRLMPDSTLGYRFRALTYEDMELYASALADYTKAIEIDPNDGNAYRSRASFYNNRREYNKAIEDINKALLINENEPMNYRCRGESYFYMNRYTEAMDDFNKAILLDEMDEGAFRLRARTYAVMKDFDKAIEDYSRAILLDPEYYDAYYARARLYLKKKDNDNALLDLEKCAELDPEDSTPFNNLGWIYFDKAEYVTALAYLKKSYELNNEDWDALLGAAMVYYINDDNESAEKLLKAAIKIEPRLKKGMSGLTILEKEGFFYSDYQKKIVKKMFEELL